MVSYYSGQYDVTNFGAVAYGKVSDSAGDIVKYTGSDKRRRHQMQPSSRKQKWWRNRLFQGDLNFASNSIHLRSNVY